MLAGLIMALAATATAAAETAAIEAAYTAAYTAARSDGRPLLILVGADWCQPCRDLRARHLDAIRRRGHLLDLDADRHAPHVARLAPGRMLPRLTLWQYDRQPGRWRHSTMEGPAEITRWLQGAAP